MPQNLLKFAPVLLLVGGLMMTGEGGCDVSPGPTSDDVSEAFAVNERLWRLAQGELANRLESGEITSEQAATDWFSEAAKQARRQAFQPLLDAEFETFGGEKWTAKAHAEHIRRYVR